jgi:hypothetical protein
MYLVFDAVSKRTPKFCFLKDVRDAGTSAPLVINFFSGHNLESVKSIFTQNTPLSESILTSPTYAGRKYMHEEN